MSERIWVDGVAAGQLPATDRGLRYGDGLFETMAVRNGRVIEFDRHLARLARGCDALGISMPKLAHLNADLDGMNLPDLAVARLTVTRGSGGRGYAPDSASTVRRIWELNDWPQTDPAIYRDGIRVVWLETQLPLQPTLAGLKHLGRIQQVMAARELQTVAADDGLLCDAWGQVIEAVSANVFARLGNILMTPKLDNCGVAGICRERVLDHAEALGLRTSIRVMRSPDFLGASEVFLTSSIRGVVPVRKLGGISLVDFDAAYALQRHFKSLDEATP
ncbi:MAG: aminodeoxychorismate lyase [Gammaproteobacteria bacterium]